MRRCLQDRLSYADKLNVQEFCGNYRGEPFSREATPQHADPLIHHKKCATHNKKEKKLFVSAMICLI
jgi:hypothetical protein